MAKELRMIALAVVGVVGVPLAALAGDGVAVVLLILAAILLAGPESSA